MWTWAAEVLYIEDILLTELQSLSEMIIELSVCAQPYLVSVAASSQTDRRRHCVLGSYVRCSQILSTLFSKRTDWFFWQIGKNDPRGKGMKRSPHSEVIGHGQGHTRRWIRWIWRPGGGIILDPLQSSSFSNLMQADRLHALSCTWSEEFLNAFKPSRWREYYYYIGIVWAVHGGLDRGKIKNSCCR